MLCSPCRLSTVRPCAQPPGGCCCSPTASARWPCCGFPRQAFSFLLVVSWPPRVCGLGLQGTVPHVRCSLSLLSSADGADSPSQPVVSLQPVHRPRWLRRSRRACAAQSALPRRPHVPVAEGERGRRGVGERGRVESVLFRFSGSGGSETRGMAGQGTQAVRGGESTCGLCFCLCLNWRRAVGESG